MYRCKSGHTLDDENSHIRPSGRIECRKCNKIRRQENYLKNKEKQNKQSKEWYKNNKEKHKLLMKEWLKNNSARQKFLQGRWYKENREKHLQSSALWAKENPEMKVLYRHNRRAREKNAVGYYTLAQLEARVDFHGGICVYCKINRYEHIDHAIPLARGGTNWPSNLVPSCQPCNNKKATKTFFEYKSSATDEVHDTAR